MEHLSSKENCENLGSPSADILLKIIARIENLLMESGPNWKNSEVFAFFE